MNTVSPTYANEIRTPTFGCGLEGVLSERRDRLSGIVNGVDYDSWDPATDPHHRHATTRRRPCVDGKAACKADLQRYFGLPEEPQIPLLGMVARLTEQKGIDLVVKAADDMLKLPVQLVILGEGDPAYHAQLYAIRDRYPKQVGLYIGFDEALAHKIEAGSDLYLMPSLFEPSGLNQLYSLRYGTPPIVRTTGGLADTIVDTTEETLVSGEPTGFRFQAYTPQALAGDGALGDASVPRPAGHVPAHHPQRHEGRLVVGPVGGRVREDLPAARRGAGWPAARGERLTWPRPPNGGSTR